MIPFTINTELTLSKTNPFSSVLSYKSLTFEKQDGTIKDDKQIYFKKLDHEILEKPTMNRTRKKTDYITRIDHNLFNYDDLVKSYFDQFFAQNPSNTSFFKPKSKANSINKAFNIKGGMQFNLKYSKDLIVVGGELEEHKHRYFPKSLYFSNLQKLVRMNRVYEAIKLAHYMILVDVTSFIRRFIVIMIEDSIVHPGILVCTQLMLLNLKKIHYLHPNVVRELLLIVGDVASCSFVDNEYRSTKVKPKHIPQHMFTGLIWTRSTYGGTEGDMNMLKTSSMLWDYRMQVSKEYWTNALKEIYDLETLDVETLTYKPHNNLVRKQCYELVRMLVPFSGENGFRIWKERRSTHIMRIHTKLFTAAAYDMHCGKNLIDTLYNTKKIHKQLTTEELNYLLDGETESEDSIKKLIGTLIWQNKSSCTLKIIFKKKQNNEKQLLQDVLCSRWYGIVEEEIHESQKYFFEKQIAKARN